MKAEGYEIDRFGSELKAQLSESLAAGDDASGLTRAVTECAAAAEAFCGERPLACGPGCPHCCVLSVAILLPEGLRIAAWLRQQPPASQSRMRARLAAHSCFARWMDDEERIFQKAACPLLDAAGSCAIHPVRPLVCRGAASFDRNSCRQAFRPMRLEQECGVAVDFLRQSIFDAAFISLAEALEQHGLDARSIELGTGILAFLDRPDCRQRLLSGGRLPDALWQ